MLLNDLDVLVGVVIRLKKVAVRSAAKDYR